MRWKVLLALVLLVALFPGPVVGASEGFAQGLLDVGQTVLNSAARHGH